MILRYIYICVVLLCSLLPAQGQIAALRGDEAYDNLLTEMGELTQRESALQAEVARCVELFKRGGDSAAIYRGRVVDMEQQMFDLRARKSVVQSDINNLEQGWMLDNLDATPLHREQSEEPQVAQVEDDASFISHSVRAAQILNPSQLQTLRDAEAQESRLELRIRGYVSNYRELARLSQEHAQTSSKQVADSIALRYATLDSLNRTIAKAGMMQWGSIADNKSFAYALLVEGMEAMDIFDSEQSIKVRAAEMVDRLSAQTQATELLNYYAGRLSMAEYEVVIAERMGLKRAVDSLKYIRDSLTMAGFSYEPTQIEERLFIDYEPIKFSSRAKYTAANPIPAGKVYDKGTIYRLLVGAFKSRQAASLFRGAYPVCIIKDERGYLAYYLGGYKTLAEAQEARAVLKKRGFRRPEVVEWRDGEPWNLTRSPRVEKSKYRVEIEGVEELSDELKSVIETQGAGRELSKIDAQVFVVGLFDDISTAENLLQSIKIMDDSVKVSVVKIE